MATTEKKAPRITKDNRFEDIATMLTDPTVRDLLSFVETKYGTTVDTAVEFINKERDLLAKKNAKKADGEDMTDSQKKNEEYKGLILDYLATLPENEGATCTDMIKNIPAFSDFNTSKVSSLTTALFNEGRVLRQKPKKGRTPFILA